MSSKYVLFDTHFSVIVVTFFSSEEKKIVYNEMELMCQVICSICNTEQEVCPAEFNSVITVNVSTLKSICLIFQVAQVCSHCGVNMGEYFCNICKFYDDDVRFCTIMFNFMLIKTR